MLLLPRHRFGCRPDHDDEDVVVLLLESFPEGVVPAHVVEWRAFDDTSHESLRKAQIGGKTLSGSVRGTGCAGVQLQESGHHCCLLKIPARPETVGR